MLIVNRATSGITPISIDAITAARDWLSGIAVRTPLVRYGTDATEGDIYLKLENLQPIGSFKLRGAANAMAVADPDELSRGVYTASAGNMAHDCLLYRSSIGQVDRVDAKCDY
jgi:threonine dehydratase